MSQDLSQSELFQLMTAEHQRTKPWWRVAATYFASHTLTEHQIDSYNTFMREKLPSIITDTEPEYSKDGCTYTISFDNVYIKKPEFTEPSGMTRKLMPQDCRIRNLNYTCRVYTDISRYTMDDEKVSDTKTFSDVFLGAFPCMVLSDYCNLHGKDAAGMISKDECSNDRGGYFIINGSEKVLMSQDRMAHNEIFIFKAKAKDTIKLPMPGTDKNSSLPCAWYGEVRSHSSACEPNISTTYLRFSRQQLDKGEDHRLYLELPGLKSPVAWPIVFMALGVTDKDEMISYVCDPDDIPMVTLLLPSLESPPIETQQQALDYLQDFVLTTQKDQKMQQLKRILREKMFQNVPQTHMKRFYLGHMTHQLLATALGRRKEDDRDHYGKKRVETAGNLINNLFKSIWKRIIREVINNLVKKRTNDLAQVFFGKITNYIKPPFATGNWTATKSSTKAAKAGISQILNRHNYVSTVSNLRRVITPNDKNSKIIKPRHLHNSQWPVMCPAETPEGQATGLIKNLATLTIISLGSSEDQIIDWLEMNPDLIEFMHDFANIKPTEIQKKSKVFVNGSWVALTSRATDLIAKLRALRRTGKISFEVSISLSKAGVRVYTDEGRVLSPFFIVNGGKLKELPESFVWADLIEKGIVEYLDPAELESLKHAEYPWQIDKTDTHAMIHPSFMLGVSAATIPFPDHNQSPRNIYQCLWEEEPVLMADGTRKPIKKVCIGDEIVTFDPETFATSTTTVVNAYTRETDKKIVQVTTVSGRQITVTADHKMMTARGWVQAGELLADDKVAISCEPEHASTTVQDTIILTAEDMATRLTELGVKPSLINSHIAQLERLDLLPLSSAHGSLPILARMFGYILGDGSLGTCLYANFVSEDSAREFVHDIERLGFLGFTRFTRFTERSVNVITVKHESAMCSLLLCLPDNWIQYGSDAVAREFLAGLQGAAGSQICWDGDENFICGPTLLEYIHGLRDFMDGVQILFGRFGVQTERVEYQDQCGFRICSTSKNLKVYYNKIGYRYCDYKTVQSGKIVEYLAYQDTCRDPEHYGTWKIETRSCVMLVPIALVEEMPNVRIGDITTASPNHCFIGGENFCVHNSAMGKQALGIFASNYLDRYDTNAHILCYPQKPLVNTQVMRLMGTEELGSGQNLIVAVMSAGYNQEDSVVVNQRALDTGALRSFCYTTYSESYHRKGNTIEEIKRPEKIFVKETRLKGYSKLDADGVSKENTPLAKRDVVIGKVNSTTEMVRDTSVVVKSNGMEENAVVELEKDGQRMYAVYNGAGIVDRAILTLNEDSFRTVKVRIRQLRVPQIGDKVASRSAQKGIIGMILPPENMPFSAKTGMSPDMLMNPNAYPSRMTMSQALETFFGKACALNGAYGDATPFEREFRKETVAEELRQYGFEECGDEIMINGMTGEQIPCKIFMGPTYYQRLKHMVDDKIHARDQDGPRETLTRQPVEGRKRGGGFRMGEMETWCGISHGASSFLIDRLVNNSDGYEMFVCDYCGNTAIANLKTQRFECKLCQQNTAISKIRIPYAFKLLMQELQACGIGVWFNVDQRKTLVAATTPSH